MKISNEKFHKFSEVTVDGSEVAVRYGRIGDAGTTSVKIYTLEKAHAEATKTINWSSLGHRSDRIYSTNLTIVVF